MRDGVGHERRLGVAAGVGIGGATGASRADDVLEASRGELGWADGVVGEERGDATAESSWNFHPSSASWMRRAAERSGSRGSRSRSDTAAAEADAAVDAAAAEGEAASDGARDARVRPRRRRPRACRPGVAPDDAEAAEATRTRRGWGTRAAGQRVRPSRLERRTLRRLKTTDDARCMRPPSAACIEGDPLSARGCDEDPDPCQLRTRRF